MFTDGKQNPTSGRCPITPVDTPPDVVPVLWRVHGRSGEPADVRGTGNSPAVGAADRRRPMDARHLAAAVTREPHVLMP